MVITRPPISVDILTFWGFCVLETTLLLDFPFCSEDAGIAGCPEARVQEDKCCLDHFLGALHLLSSG